MPTIFSRIISGEIPSYKIAEDEKFYAFLDINPIQKGHTLVVPKVETDYFFDLDDRTVGEMMVFAKKIAGRIKSATGCNRVALAVLGLEIPHAHLHLIPINAESDLDFKKKLKLTEEEFQQIRSMIAQ